MLVLGRHALESILIGDDIKITVMRIGPNSVRIGIEAPEHVHIVREELVADPKWNEREIDNDDE